MAFCLVPAVAAPADPAWRRAEAEGDREEARAAPMYRSALAAWRQVEAHARRAGDGDGTARARHALDAILLRQRAPEVFRRMVISGRSRDASPLPVSLSAEPGTGGVPSDDALERLAAFMTRAARAHVRSSTREERDTPLLFEALALCLRLRADAMQLRADAAFRKALSLIDDVEPGPRELAGRVRILFKLRDFSAVSTALRSRPIDEESLEVKERHELLSIARDVARLRGDSDEALALTRRINRLNLEKAEEQPPPLSPLGGFITASLPGLRAASATLLSVLATCELEPRSRSIAAYLAGVATLEAGDAARAIEILDGIRPEDCGGPWLRTLVRAHAARAHERAGDYEGALARYTAARVELQPLGDAVTFDARLVLNVAGVHLRLGALDDARRLAATVVRSAAAPVGVRIRARLALGDVLYFTPAADAVAERRLREDALAAYRLAAGELDAARDALGDRYRELEAQVAIHAGNASFRLASLASDGEETTARLRDAAGHAERARAVAGESTGDPLLARLAAVATANLAELRLELGDLDDARTLAREAIDAARELGSFETEWRALWYLGRVGDLTGAAADALWESAARIIEEHRARILDPELKIGYMSGKQAFFAGMSRRAFVRGDLRGAFEVAERARSRAFIETLGLRYLLIAADRDRAIYREYVSLIGRAARARRESADFYGLRVEPGEDHEELRAQIARLRELVRSSPKVSPTVKALVEGAVADIETVQRGLGAAEALVEYCSIGDSLIAFVVSRSRFEAVDLRVAPARVASLAGAFVESQAADARLAGDLHAALVAPLEAELAALFPGSLPDPLHVRLVPWGPLHGVPFEALRRSDGDRAGRLLIEEWEIAYMPSASMLRYLQPSRDSGRPARLVALVDPDTDYDRDGKPDLPQLPFARTEVGKIAPLFADPVVLAGDAALEEACVRLTRAADVVHLACHGEFFPSRPLDSTLYLTPGQSSDGRLRTAEVFGIDLRRSRLVTLSGCETGRFDVRAGDEPVGLGTAFLHSGARALLLSLWRVEDEATAVLMERFYRTWLADTDVDRADALRRAKLSMIREGTFRHPRQWAAFVLVGLR